MPIEILTGHHWPKVKVMVKEPWVHVHVVRSSVEFQSFAPQKRQNPSAQQNWWSCWALSDDSLGDSAETMRRNRCQFKNILKLIVFSFTGPKYSKLITWPDDLFATAASLSHWNWVEGSTLVNQAFSAEWRFFCYLTSLEEIIRILISVPLDLVRRRGSQRGSDWRKMLVTILYHMSHLANDCDWPRSSLCSSPSKQWRVLEDLEYFITSKQHKPYPKQLFSQVLKRQVYSYSTPTAPFHSALETYMYLWPT